MPTLTPWIHCRNKTAVGRRVAVALHALQTAGAGGPGAGPHVWSARLTLGATDRPRVLLDMSAALELALAEGCVLCCAQTAAGFNASFSPFELANHAGVWLPAAGAVVNVSTVVVTPLPRCQGRG